MAEMTLPPEYQQEIEDAQRKRALALALQQFALQNRPQGQMVGGHYVRSSPMQHLANVFGQAQGAYFDTKASHDINATRGRFMQDQSADLAKMQELSPDEAEKHGRTSKFPQSQAMAKALFEARMKRVAEMQKELAGRVSVEQVPQVFGGQTTGLTPKKEHKVESGVPYATSERGIEFTGKPTISTVRVGDKDVRIQTLPDGREVVVAGDQPSTNVNVNPNKGVPQIMADQWKDLAGQAGQLRDVATRTIPALNRVAESVKQGIVQGSLGEPRQAVFKFAQLFGIGSKDWNDMIERTGGVRQALAAISAETIKRYGANPSNIDLINQQIANGSINDGPQALYLTMQAAQADLFNSLQQHDVKVKNFAADFPEVGGRTASISVAPTSLPRMQLDERAYRLNPGTGFFEWNKDFAGIPEIPQQRLFGPSAPAGGVRLKTLEELRREHLN